jgi:hypothetical protein
MVPLRFYAAADAGRCVMSETYSLREHLEAALDAIEEAHDTHIFSDDDEHPEDCQYCAIVRDGRAALNRLAHRK